MQENRSAFRPDPAEEAYSVPREPLAGGEGASCLRRQNSLDPVAHFLQLA